MELSPTTKNLISLLEDGGLIRLKKNNDRKTKCLDKVFQDFIDLSFLDKNIKVFESKDPYEMIIVASGSKIPYTFII